VKAFVIDRIRVFATEEGYRLADRLDGVEQRHLECGNCLPVVGHAVHERQGWQTKCLKPA
jgi:hypothetical protein